MTAKYLPTTVPGYFTGVYTGKTNSYLPAQSTQTVPVSKINFADELKNISKQNSVQIYRTKNEIQNVSNYLPFTALVASEIGHYGLILSASPALKLCQYYKKTSPSPRY